MIEQQLLNGLVLGSVYALFSLGFTLVFGVHHILNLAHGAVFMMSAFFSIYCIALGLDVVSTCIASAIFGGLLAVVLDFFAFKPLRKRAHDEYAGVISSIGANLILLNIAQRLSDTSVMHFPFGTFPIIFFSAFGLRISLLQIVIVGTVIVMVAVLLFYLHRTSFGRQVRAVAGNERASALLGVNPNFVFFQTFFISGAFAGIAGVLISFSINAVQYEMGEPFLQRAFVIIVLGGLGSIPGALIAGLLIGILETAAVAFLASGATDIIVSVLLFIILLVRPNGLLGRVRTTTAGGRA